MSKHTKLVWSDDPRDKDKLTKAPDLKNADTGGAWTAVFRLEKSGRGGKTVTVLDQLPRNEAFVKDLCKELKNKCGTGGTYEIKEVGVIEIQGDKRVAIKAILDKKNIKYKGM